MSDKLFLKNYTSDVPVAQTIHRIEQVLVRCGATGIAKEYQGAKITAVTFRIVMDTKEQVVRIPAKEDAVQDALWQDYCRAVGRRRKIKADFRDQAERTAWKLMQDWIEVQMSMVMMKQADAMEVFLPFVWDGRQTFYAMLKERGFKGMLPEKCE